MIDRSNSANTPHMLIMASLVERQLTHHLSASISIALKVSKFFF
jgi:hypothetical protein